MQYRIIAFIFILCVAVATGRVYAGDDGERFKAGNLDAETAAMLNVPPDNMANRTTDNEAAVVPESPVSDVVHSNENETIVGTTVVSDVSQDEEDTDVEVDSQDITASVDAEPVIDENTRLAYIPELDFYTDGRRRREMTPELAVEYPAGKFVPRTVTNNAWDVGEKLTFQITYGFYQAGTATMTILDKKEVNGSLCFHIQTKARSNSFISSFYKVRDSVDSFIDVEGIFSRRLEKRLREGKYKADRMVDFYHDRQLALNTRDKHAVTEIPLYVQDILSSLYYLRTFDLEVGKHQEITAYADGKVYPLKVLVHKREKIEVPAGKFNCYKVEPVLKSEGIFRQKGKLTIWLTDDEYKMPVKMESKIAIGSIATKLESYERNKK